MHFRLCLENMEDQAVIFKNDILRGISLAVKNVSIATEKALFVLSFILKRGTRNVDGRI